MGLPKMSLSDRFHSYVPRFVTNPSLADKLRHDLDSYTNSPSPPATWTKATKSESGQPLPQLIAHRGFKSKYPENTMLAFQKAVSAGAQALETDVHLTKDNVVALTHDPSLKRCYGKDKLIVDCEWAEIQTLRTVALPPQPMPRLTDLLEYLAQPEQKDIWLLLDIKMDDDPDLMMKSIAEAIVAVSRPSKPWSQTIVLGIWAVKYLTPCAKYLPEYALSNISFSTIYSRQFLSPKTPNVSFNMLYFPLMMPISGTRFINDAHIRDRAVYAWTVNDENMMKWFMNHQVDAIITDDVEKLANVRTAWQNGDRQVQISLRTWIFTVWIWILATIVGGVIRARSSGRFGLKAKRIA